MSNKNAAFMQPVVEEGDWVMLDGPNGGETIPADVVDLDEVRDLMKRMEEGEKKISLEGTNLHTYTQNHEIYDLDIKHGFGAHFIAPGYMDQTEWTVFDTEKEAVEFLKEQDDEEEDDSEVIDAIVIVKSLDQRNMVVGELPGPYETLDEALEQLEPGQQYEVRDGIVYAEEIKNG